MDAPIGRVSTKKSEPPNTLMWPWSPTVARVPRNSSYFNGCRIASAVAGRVTYTCKEMYTTPPISFIDSKDDCDSADL